MSWEKSMFIGCSHGDLIDREAEKVAKQFMEDWKPKHRVHLGDLWDFRALRRGAGPEERAEGVRYDYNCGNELLDWFKPQLLTLGNHDHRVWRAAGESSQGVLAEFCQGFADEIETDLRKRKLKWCHYTVSNYLQLPMGGPKIVHGSRSTVHPAKALFDDYGNAICAHVHKPDYYAARHIDGGKAHVVGTLGNISKMTYADSYTAKLGWRNSFLYGIHNTKTGAWKCWDVTKEDGQWVSPMGVI